VKVAVYYSNKDIRIEEMEIPKISDGEVLMRTKACGICGSDVLEWYRRDKAPVILGHEAVGEIVESRSSDYKIGQRIFASHHVPCNKCYYCLEGYHTACSLLRRTNYDPGGFSEYIRLSRENAEFGIYPLPDISYESATLIEALGCVIRAQRLAGLKMGQRLIVFGCGVSGLLHIILAKKKGVYTIGVDINEYKLNFAKKFGCDLVLNGNRDINTLADCIVLCTGSPQAIEKTFSCLDKGSVLVFFAVPSPDIRINFPITRFWRNEVKIITSYGAGPKDLDEALRLVEKMDLESMITHRFPLEKIQDGFLVVERQDESMKAVVTL